MPDKSTAPAPPDRPLRVALLAERAAMLAYVDRRLPASLRGSVDPLDVVHDVCCEALRRADAFRPEDASSGRRWLFTIARRRILRLLERQRVAKQRTESGRPAGDDPVGGLLDRLATYERTPSQSAAAHEVIAEVQRALGRLATAHAAVIRARHIDRRSAIDVAAQMGRSPAAIDKLLQRAMAALRVELRSLIAAHG